jgi:hypothetical protein
MRAAAASLHNINNTLPLPAMAGSPPPECLQRHGQPSWLPRERLGWLASCDEGAASAARFWGGETARRLAALPSRTREQLVATATGVAADNVARVLPLLMEARTLRALAAPAWTALERGSESAVRDVVRQLFTCEACHHAALDVGALEAARARLKFIGWCACAACPPPSVDAVECHTPNGAFVCAAGCSHTAAEAEHKLIWATARRLAVQETLAVLGIMVSGVDWATARSRGDDAVAALLAGMAGALDAQLDSVMDPRLAPCARVLRAAPWPTGPLRSPTTGHAARRGAPAGGRPPPPAMARQQPAAPAAAQGKTCSACGVAQPRGAFSQRQWAAAEATRRCIACTVDARTGAEADAGVLAFPEFAAAFEAIVRKEFPNLSVGRDGDFVHVNASGRAPQDGARLAMRNYAEQWPGIAAGDALRSRVVSVVAAVVPMLEAQALRSSSGVDGGGDEMAAAPWTVLLRSGSFFVNSEMMQTRVQRKARLLLPYPELDAASRAPFAPGPLLAMCLAKHMAFATHREVGTTVLAMADLSRMPREEQRALLHATIASLGTARAPTTLTPGVHDAGGVRCTVEALLPGEGAAPSALRVEFSDACAPARLACAAFADRLAAALRCTRAQLVAVPLLCTTLLVTRCDAPLGCCALGDFALYDDLEPPQQAQHLSSRPLRLQEELSHGAAVWVEYELYGGHGRHLQPRGRHQPRRRCGGRRAVLVAGGAGVGGGSRVARVGLSQRRAKTLGRPQNRRAPP